jgi:fermentation-respiration switch protein FrsA (DUF1100 family)
LALWAFLRWFERLNLYFPDRRITRTPADADLPFEELRAKTQDGVTIRGWLIPAGDDAPVLIVCHGNAGNISNRVGRAAAFRSAGLSTLLFDYRGYGESDGRPSERGMQLDAQAAYDWLAAKGVPPSRIIAFGESLGGSVALELALSRPTAGAATESSPTSTVERGQELFPWLPVRWIAKYRYDALARIAVLKRPVFVAHSPTDEIIPFRHGERLFAAAHEPKTFYRLSGGHNDALEASGDPYLQALSAFCLRARSSFSASP